MNLITNFINLISCFPSHFFWTVNQMWPFPEKKLHMPEEDYSELYGLMAWFCIKQIPTFKFHLPLNAVQSQLWNTQGPSAQSLQFCVSSICVCKQCSATNGRHRKIHLCSVFSYGALNHRLNPIFFTEICLILFIKFKLSNVNAFVKAKTRKENRCAKFPIFLQFT